MKYKLLFLVLTPSLLGAMNKKRPCPIVALEKTVIAQKIAKCQIPEHQEFIEIFYRHGPFAQKVENKDRFLLLRKLVTSGQYAPLLRHLIERKLVDPNSYFTQGKRVYRLLNEAVYSEAPEMVQALLQAGADPNLPAHNFEVSDSPEELPLTTSVAHLDNWTLSVLLHAKRANPNQLSADFFPLTHAIQWYAQDIYPQLKEDSLRSIAVLLLNGASPDVMERNPDGTIIFIRGTQIPLTPRALATHRKYTEILKLFDQAQAEGYI